MTLATGIATEVPTGGGASPADAAAHAEVVELAFVTDSGARQMARDDGLLDSDAARGGGATPLVYVRRYVWSPPAASLGKFQRFSADARVALAAAGIDVVRRPSGGRLVLHGAGFEWSFAVAIPASVLPYGTNEPYRSVSRAMAAALADHGIALDDGREAPYTRSALCFASALRHDLLVKGGKAVAVAQARRGDRILVHGSVLERRPPARLVAAVEVATGEPWTGEGLGASSGGLDRDALWRSFVGHLRAALSAPSDRVRADDRRGRRRLTGRVERMP